MNESTKKAMFSSLRLDWRTPAAVYAKLDEEFHFNCDPCPPSHAEDGLTQEWGSCCFVNPPYGREVLKWAIKGVEEAKKGKTIVFLLAARTDTIWFQDWLLPNSSEIRFIRGRLHFGESKNSAPFPSMVCILRGGS